jgi:HNH endonuclease
MVEWLRERFSYDPETGMLTWRDGKYAGQPVATRKVDGYLVIRPKINGKRHYFRVHRVAFALMTGEWPLHDIDHWNGVRDNNRWKNLRSATRSENKQNLKGPLRSGSSGLLGVSPRYGRWQANIKTNGRQTHLGYFTTKEEAHQAYLTAKAKVHPFGGFSHG